MSRTIDAAGRQTDFEYDSLGRQTAAIDHPVLIGTETVRHRAEKVYNTHGQLWIDRANVRQLADGTIDRSLARETTYDYDQYGNLVKTTFADGTFVTALYDARGRKTSETNQLGLTRSFEYDSSDRLSAVVLPAVTDPATGLPANPRYEYAYDAQGRQTLVRDPLGRETRFTYDAQGNQLTRTLPLGFGPDGVEGTGDDATLPEGDFTERFEYDERGRQTLHVSFEGKVAQSVYDPATGRLNARKFFDNLTQYNTGTPTETWTYKFDAFGREVEVRQQLGAAVRTTTTGYDEQGRVESIASPEGTVNYRYDAFGRRTRMFTGSEADPTNDVRYSYDALSRLTAVEVYERDNVVLSTPERTSYRYDLVGNLDLQRKPGGVVDDFVYDALNRLDTLITFKDVGDDNAYTTGVDRLLAEYDYTVGDDGRRTGLIERFWWDDGADGLLDPHENRLTWIYDNAGRLTDEVFDHYDNALDQTEHFVYDLVGNRRTQTLDRGNNGSIDETTDYLYDANDRLTTETAGAKVTSYGYCGTQQWVKEVRESGTLASRSEFLYDLQGRMESAKVTSYTSGVASRIERTTFDYSDAGIRVSALQEIDADANGTYETATRTEFLNDPANPTGYSQVLQETITDPATGQIQKRVVYAVGLDQITQTTTAYSGGEPQSSETLVFNADGHGSTRLLTDLAGAILTLSGVRQLFAYDAYGNALGFNPAQAATAFLYSGEQFDAGLGLQYLRARYYDPATARFNRLDPFFGNLHDPQSLHKYLYTHGDPTNNFDPSGKMSLQSNLIAVTICAALGAFSYGVYFGSAKKSLAQNMFEGGIVGGQLSGGLILAKNKLMAFASGFATAMLESLIITVQHEASSDPRPLSEVFLLGETQGRVIRAVSDGVFDTALDQWVGKGPKYVTSNYSQTIRRITDSAGNFIKYSNQVDVSGILGLYPPIFTLFRAYATSGSTLQERKLATNDVVTAVLTYIFNESGLNVAGKLPQAIANRLGRLSIELYNLGPLATDAIYERLASANTDFLTEWVFEPMREFIVEVGKKILDEETKQHEGSEDPFLDAITQ